MSKDGFLVNGLLFYSGGSGMLIDPLPLAPPGRAVRILTEVSQDLFCSGEVLWVVDIIEAQALWI
jgi:hypothetical protein